MAADVNGARGEVALAIAGVDLVIAATMKGLASLSTEIGCKSFGDLFDRLAGGEIDTVMKAIPHLTVKGNAAKAVSDMQLSDMPAAIISINAALAHHLGSKSKNAPAAKDKAA